ncbi:42265_t:CDS:1, partial [Gigaspora margarita]
KNDPYHDLSNNILLGYQVQLDVNMNHSQAPTLASAFLLDN